MNDIPTSASSESSITDKAQLAQWHDEAAAAAGEPNLRERVRDLTSRALRERKMNFHELRGILGAITSGVGSGLASRGGEMKAGLKEAVSGLDEAVGTAAQKMSYTLREAADQGRSFRDHELKDSLEQLRTLESQLIDTLKQTANHSGGKLKEEMETLSAHLKNSGTRTGEQVRDALQQLASGVKTTAETGRECLSEAATTTADRLSEAASGVLAAMSDALKRQSDRLRH
ncbi:MAG: hypothetical protein IV085_10390 [Thiobacillus sp.]|nr:hypothetical protein [Thiobacillus sp.]